MNKKIPLGIWVVALFYSTATITGIIKNKYYTANTWKI